MRTIRMALLGCALLLLAAPGASAQGFLKVFVGGNFGGSSGVSLDESINDTKRLDFGASLGAMSAGIFGGEVDFGYTPNFYGKGTIFDSSNVLTVMGNLLLGLPTGPVRPYGLVGIGLIRRSVKYAPGENQSNITDSRAAWDFGGGVNFYVSKHVAINGDLRYFRNFTSGNEILDLSNDKFNFARGSVGVTFRF